VFGKKPVKSPGLSLTGFMHQRHIEALGAAINVNAGAALIYSARAMDAWHEKTES
jgi:hypothetical protein